MSDLFDDFAPTVTTAPGPHVTYSPALFRGHWTIEALAAALPLKQRTASMYGKTFPVPRLESWHGARPYAFGGRVEQPQPWPDLLVALRCAVEDATGEGFDSCFANLYRSGADQIPWHADDAEWIGPVIASVTFGDARRFVMRRKDAKGRDAPVWSWTLGDGDLFVMHAGVQAEWLHALPRTTAKVGARLNLTFRQTVEQAP